MKIELPDDVYRLLQEIAVPFEEPTPADVIRRLLRQHSGASREAAEANPDIPLVTMSRGELLPLGRRIRGKFRGQMRYAEITEEGISFQGQSFSAPSAAAIAAAQDMGARSQHINGWRWWEIEEPAGSNHWLPLERARSYPGLPSLIPADLNVDFDTEN